MKRSAMVEILRTSFIHHMNNPEGAETDDEMYSNILKDLENAGMRKTEKLYLIDDDNPYGKVFYRLCKWKEE